MKLNLIALTALLGLAVAQSSTSTGEASATTSLSPEASCAKKCSDNDLCCVASCYKVPCPSDSQANDTVSCVAACPQGTGSPSDTDRYAKCQSSCYSSHFFPATKLSDSGSSATHASSNSDSKTTGTSDDDSSSATGSSTGHHSGSGSSASASATGTSSGSEASETANAAALKLGVSTAGVIGLVLGALAL
ncbi:hypothetical protein P170DRAFT_274320 [Aspergillus steynii IBT 23096]|uniref:Extracellular membrane protein CFEM domain-containing protein n=1 Tax=Aspergillus steynii IBT 23096 TaxID=1392250 RepID=A0A2I2FX02_9EURO|nr:uncharacterized protein P170DRAFT_274320 [Aspergillus steynii IBT 23096]PLB45171.1 hypothetical protein P170DRAFT_274320 [Aspergillus steynii IBT 23096]